MIQIPEELIEAVNRRQELVAVTQVVLAELARGLAYRLEHGCNGRGFIWNAERRAGLADRGEAGADGQLAGDEVRAPGRATRLRVVVSEPHALRSQPIQVGRPTGHDP